MQDNQDNQDGIVIINEEIYAPLIKRCIQIADFIQAKYSKEELLDLSLDELALRFKLIAIEFNCYIRSWVDANEALAEAYNAEEYSEEDDTTWGLIAAKYEAYSIIGAFKWLSDKGYFTEERKNDAY